MLNIPRKRLLVPPTAVAVVVPEIYQAHMYVRANNGSMERRADGRRGRTRGITGSSTSKSLAEHQRSLHIAVRVVSVARYLVYSSVYEITWHTCGNTVSSGSMRSSAGRRCRPPLLTYHRGRTRGITGSSTSKSLAGRQWSLHIAA